MQGKIKEVYEDEMVQEIAKMGELIDRYNYISIVIVHLIIGYRVSWVPIQLPFRRKSNSQRKLSDH
jgi:hypothetical protein